MKQYLKRVFSTFVFFNVLIVLTGILASFIQHILFFTELQEKTLYIIGFIPASIAMLYFVYLYRWENRSMKQRYFETLISEEFSLIKEFIAVLKARENIIHTMAFLMIVFIFDLRIAISEHTPLVQAILTMVLLLLVRGVAFAVLNTSIWCLVHRRWHKSRFIKK